jgi:SAM-dependent methyltransferase
MICAVMNRTPRSQSSTESLRELRRWCRQPLGGQLVAAEQQVLREVLSDVFGYHLVVLDPACSPDSLAASRILHRVVQSGTSAGLEHPPGLVAQVERLPFQSDSIDAFVLQHVLEWAQDAHQVLREIDRCLVAEGHLIVTGFNPWGWWGLRKLITGWRNRVPWRLRFISLLRLKDWLSLLGFDTIETRYLFPRPPWSYGGGAAADVFDRLHRDSWPPLAASYLLVARKRVATLTPVKPRWRPRRSLITGVAEPGQGRLRANG